MAATNAIGQAPGLTGRPTRIEPDPSSSAAYEKRPLVCTGQILADQLSIRVCPPVYNGPLDREDVTLCLDCAPRALDAMWKALESLK